MGLNQLIFHNTVCILENGLLTEKTKVHAYTFTDLQTHRECEATRFLSKSQLCTSEPLTTLSWFKFPKKPEVQPRRQSQSPSIQGLTGTL